MSYKKAISNFTLSVSLFCLSFFLAWQISSYSNFLYPVWYEVLDLNQAIMQYAPDNKFKRGFENTNKQQHVELFSGIVDAIKNDGAGLKKLRYIDLKNNVTDTLLTDAEVLHLQDVAHLVNKFIYLAVFGLVVSLVVFVVMQVRGASIAKFKHHLLGGLGVIVVLIMLVLVMGPKEMFYVGHELVFPNNHQWFFYYEESLMSAMMKAPALFGPIAGQLLLLTVLLWLVALYVLQKIQLKPKKV